MGEGPVSIGRRAARVAGAAALAFLAPAAHPDTPPLRLASRAPGLVSRAAEPVLVPAGTVSPLIGRRPEEIGLFSWDGTSESFAPIPWQLDERVRHVFNEGTELEFTELIYDVFGEDDGRIDADDELVFLFGDAGDRAPPAAAWPPTAESERIELRVRDSRPGSPEGERWAYVFFGPGLARSPRRDVTWPGGPAGDVGTDTFTIEYEDRWLLTGLRITPPCGAGTDLLDRVKGRARPLPDLWEDEDGWNSNSFYLGGLVGPLRAIRYVRGATSGVNTIQRDVIYRSRWERTVNLRVHPIFEARLYFDWRPLAGARLFAPAARQGVDIDGVPDALPTDFTTWAVVSSDAGGAVLLFDAPLGPLYAGREFFYRDDASWNDAIPTHPDYGDEDDSAWGAAGLRLVDIAGSNIDPIPLRTVLIPLCAGEGSAELGEAFAELVEDPLELTSERQTEDLNAIRSLRLSRTGDDVRLDWQEIPGSDAYRVYSSPRPDRPRPQWTLAGEVTAPPFVDRGGALGPGLRSYSVVTVSGGAEGTW